MSAVEIIEEIRKLPPDEAVALKEKISEIIPSEWCGVLGPWGVDTAGRKFRGHPGAGLPRVALRSKPCARFSPMSAAEMIAELPKLKPEERAEVRLRIDEIEQADTDAPKKIRTLGDLLEWRRQFPPDPEFAAILEEVLFETRGRNPDGTRS